MSTLKLIITLVVLVVLLIFIWPLLDRDLVPVDNTPIVEEPGDNLPTNDQPVTPIIFAQTRYENGTRFYTGQIELPTPCHALSYESVVAESFPEQVFVDFTITPPEVGAFCIQVTDLEDFELAFQVDERASVTFRINGELAQVIDPRQEEQFHVQ